jgi:putative effector of murein hydrolase
LTLSFPMTFQTGYAGAKGTFLYAADLSGATSGWLELGTWTVPGASGVPTTVSVTPSSGSGASENFALQYSDTAGASSLQVVYVWFATTFGTVANSCLLSYQPATNQVSLDNNAATSSVSATVGSASTLANSQCSLNMSAATAVLNGDTLTLNFPMTFEAGYAGAKGTFLYAADLSGATSGWQELGTWTVPGVAGVPTAVSANPSSGSGTSHTFALQYSDTAGASSLQVVYVWFATTFGTVVNSCLLSYQPATDQVSLDSNAGTSSLSATVGSASTLANSQCSLNMSAATAVLNGNTLTLSFPMTFQTGYAGAKGTFLYAADLSGATSGWLELGTWTVP